MLQSEARRRSLLTDPHNSETENLQFQKLPANLGQMQRDVKHDSSCDGTLHRNSRVQFQVEGYNIGTVLDCGLDFLKDN